MALPTPTALAATVRYIAAGTRKWLFVPTIATQATPSSAEFTAGTDLTKQIKPDGVSGFAVTADQVDAGDYGTNFTSKAPGMISADDSSLTFNADKSGVNPVATLLARGVSGYIVDCFGGIVTSGKCNIFPVTVTTSDPTTGSNDEIVGWMVGFAITGIPSEGVVLPTA